MKALTPSGFARVLVVDDNREDMTTYSRWLEACQERSLAVVTATSLTAALEICAQGDPDCILLDYDLIDATGLEFMAELTERGFQAPVIVITGNGSEAIAVDFMKAGARDYLVKSRMSAGDLCSAVIAQLSPEAMHHQLADYRERERMINAELRTALARVSFLAETGTLLAATLDYSELLDLAVTRALPFLGEACLVDMVERGGLRRRSVSVDPVLTPSAAWTPGMLALRDDRSGAARARLADEKLYVAGEPLAEAARGDADIAALVVAGVAAVAFLPLRSAGRVLGVLTIGTTRAGGFSAAERSLCEDYAQRIAVALANARIVESERFARDRAEVAKHRLTFQSRISTLFAQSLDWENALQKLMKIVTTSFCDTAAIFSVEGNEERIRFVAAASHDAGLKTLIEHYYTDFPPRTTDTLGIGRAVRKGRSQFFSEILFAPGSDELADRRQRELVRAWAPVSLICVPVHVKGTGVGALMFVRDVSGKPFGNEDVTVAEDVARRTATYMETAQLYEREHGIASTLQQALLPAQLPVVNDVLFGVRYFAGAEGMDVGGDWYDIIEVSEDRMVITIGDVIGRGIVAAVAMGRYRDILRAYAFESYDPAAALTRLNDLVHAVRGEAFATCIIIVLDRAARRMQYASAGHPPPMLRLPGGVVRVLDAASSMPIGAWPETVYLEKTVDMPVGATLVLYTDGLVETRHRSASDGVDVLRTALERSPPDIEQMLDGILRDVAPDRSDDIAIVAIEMLPLQSETLTRWVRPGIDSAIVQAIRNDFDLLIESGSGADSDIFGARLILGELLSNIVQHAPGAFRLELDWSAVSPELRLYDNGPGLSARVAPRVPDDILSMTGRGLFLIAQIGRNFSMLPRPRGGLATTVTLPVCRKSQERELVLH